MSIPLWSESIRVFLKISFKYRFNYYLYRHLYYFVFDGWYPQRPFTSIRFWNVYPSDWHSFVYLVLQFINYACKIPLFSTLHLLYALKGYPVSSRAPCSTWDKSLGHTQGCQSPPFLRPKIQSILLFLF